MPDSSVPPSSQRRKIIDALLSLLTEQPIERIGLAALAQRAGVTLGELRSEFNSTLEILAAFAREIDREVLDHIDPELQDSPARERLFDVLMRRFETLKPHRASLRSLARSCRCNPALALALNKFGVRSQVWMLAAAGINSAGSLGRLRAQALLCLYGRAMREFLDDEDPAMARTMAALDRELDTAERLERMREDLCSCFPFGRSRWRRDRDRRYRRGEDPPAEPIPV